MTIRGGIVLALLVLVTAGATWAGIEGINDHHDHSVEVCTPG